MIKHRSKSPPAWADVKGKLEDFDRAALLDLVRDLYAAHEDNRLFIHTRLGLGDVLEPYKRTIDRWVCPDIFLRQDTSVSRAKQAISAYKKAVGDSEGLAELTVFYCERAAAFSNDIVTDDEGYLYALAHMFERALKLVSKLPAGRQAGLLERLDTVRRLSQGFHYGVGDELNDLFTRYRGAPVDGP